MPVAVAPDRTKIEATIEDFRIFAEKTRGTLKRPSVGRVAVNIRFDEELGSFAKRKSRAKYGGMATLGTSVVKFATRYYKESTGAKKFVIAYSTTLKVGDDNAGTFANIATGLTADEDLAAITYKDLLYIFSEADTAQVYDGTNNCVDIGVPSPGAATVATGAAGALTGDYYYKISFVLDDYQEGNSGTASALVQPSSEKVDLSAIPTSSNTRCTARKIYRTAAGGSVYYYLATISDNTTTTYEDNTADGSLDTTQTAPTDKGGPDANYRLSLLKNNRLFLAKGSKVAYSHISGGISYPDIFPANNYFYVTRDDGEEITFILEDHIGNVVISKPNAVVVVDIDTASPVAWSGMNKVRTTSGAICPDSAVKTDYGILYISGAAEGGRRFMLWDGSTSKPVYEELWPLISRAPRSLDDTFKAAHRDGIYYLAFNDPSYGAIIQNTVLILNLVNGRHMIDRKNVACFSLWSNRNDFGELYTGTSDTTGFCYREDTEVEDIILKTISDLDAGTYSQCEATGTEDNPVLSLIQSELQDDIGASLISAASDTISDLTGDLDTVAPSATYTSDVYEVNAVNLDKLYWNEVLGSYGEVLFWVRTGDTLVEIAAASYSGPYTTPSGSDISGATPKKYIQFKCKLYVTEADTSVSQAPNIYLYRGAAPSDYVIKLTLGQGELSESAISMLWESDWQDFGWLDPRLKNRRKHFHTAKIEFDRSVATGSFAFGYRFDNKDESTRVEKTFNFSDVASRGFAVYTFPIKSSFAKFIKWRLTHSDDTEDLSFYRVTFVLTVEPLNRLF